MSIKVMSHVWDHSPHTGSDLLMLLAIADHANDEGLAWPSIPTLAKKCRVGKRQAIYIIQKLERAGSLSIEHGGGRGHASVYRVKGASQCTVSQKGAVECTVLEEKVQCSAPLPEIKGALQRTKGAVQCTPTIIDPSEELKPKDPPLPPTGELGWIEGSVVTGGRARPQPIYPPGFLQFWDGYPPARRASKPTCLKVWHKAHLEDRTTEVCAKVEGLKHTVWQGKEPHFIPMTLTWLSQGRYDDDPMTPPAKPGLWGWARELEERQHATQ